MEDALRDGAKSLLILEDDAVFSLGFAAEFAEFWRELPDDWHGVMLGGQHLKPPRVVSSNILRVVNGNRTHAHAFRGIYLIEAYRHLCDYPSHAESPEKHVDHRLGALHESGHYNIYAPSRWLVGQRSGFSSIRRQATPERFWNRSALANDDPSKDDLSGSRDGMTEEASGAVVAVLGTYRSGSSCIAGILHRLGFHMGTQLAKGNRGNPQGYYEPVSLSRQLRQLCDEPRLEEPSPREFKVRALQQWFQRELQVANRVGKPMAAKHPLFCILGNEILEAWGSQTRFISVVRPLEDSVRSLNRAGWWQMPYRQFVLKSLWDAREAFLAGREHLQIEYDQLLAQPRSEVSRITRFLVLPSAGSQFEEAVNFVQVTPSEVTVLLKKVVGDRTEIAPI